MGKYPEGVVSTSAHELINSIDAVLEQCAGRRLSPTEKLALQAAWEGKTYQEVSQAAGYSANTLKGAGSTVFGVLSGLFGEPIAKHNFRQRVNLDRLLALGLSKSEASRQATHQTRYLGSIPEVHCFYGRTRERTELSALLQSQRCTALLGCEGIGKRTLAAKLIEEKAVQRFDAVIWCPLHYKPSIQQFVREILQRLEIESIDCSAGDDASLLAKLISVLQQTRCLLILEGAEALIDPPARFPESYLGLLRRLIEQTKTCMLLTTQVPILGLDILALRGLAVTTYRLEGLDLEDARQIFTDENLSDPELWDDIIQIFGGNPLLLRLVAQRSRTRLGGRLNGLNRFTICLSVIEEWIAERIEDLPCRDRNFLVELHRMVASQTVPISKVVQTVPLDTIERFIQATLIRTSLSNNQQWISFNPLFSKYLTNHQYVQAQG